jgi:surface polysaccharide O-acyltransferase-like enzyme
MIVPAAGYVFGRMLIRAKDVDRFYGRFSLPALAVALIYLPIGIHQEWGMFGEGQNCYYHMNSWDVFISLCMTVAMLGIWHLVSRYIPEREMRFFTEVSININAFYCIHWVFVRTITNVMIYIRTGTQELPLGTTMMLAASIMVVSVIMAHYWRRWKIYYRGNRPVY